MSIMQPTNHLRWNRRPDTGLNRLEQLWTVVTAAPDTILSPDYIIPEPKKEWRPIQLVKLGWVNGKYDEPLEYDGT